MGRPVTINPQPGDRFGRLTFTSTAPSVGGERMGTFRCSCGNLRTLRIRKVAGAGTVRSCGCLRSDALRAGWARVNER